VREEGGQVYWYPSRDTRPVFDDDTQPLASTGTSP
jgi:hypothetical protein